MIYEIRCSVEVVLIDRYDGRESTGGIYQYSPRVGRHRLSQIKERRTPWEVSEDGQVGKRNHKLQYFLLHT